jgi:hypothetical protein
MARTIKIFSATSGINNKLDPVRLKYDYRKGISDFVACVNCDIDDTGRPFRRKGFTATTRTESFHSLFSAGSFGLGVTGNALAVINADMSKTNIRNVTQNARMSYVRDTDGTQDVIYYANGYENGRVINKISNTWPVGTYVGPETRKTFYAPPIGHLLEIRNLRMFIAVDNILWYSEPGAFNLYRLASNYFGFPSRLRMIQAVDGGLWVSDSERIYFLGGEIAPTIQEMPVQKKKADYAAFEGSAVKVPGSRIGEGMEGIVVVFATPEGVCIGTGDGQLINLTERKIALPSGLTGAGFYRDGKYIVTIN